jgi:aspartate aminotransferase-like enzyme
MAEYVRGWVQERGFGFLPAEPYRSLTLTCAVNSREIDLAELKKRLGERGYAFDNGYGKIKGKTFRIAHMGDMQLADLQDFTGQIDDILKALV